ncbi:FecR domain-containing protein [Lentisphaerota bacterium ZTH]|nr:PD40 domain-containing protein [Lentisphaerota bacterium]WET07022.1 FecR domain-containing protein [Lentisphaerota bacterium ZTH]
MNNHNAPLSDEMMDNMLKNHTAISAEAKQRIADKLLTAVEQKTAPLGKSRRHKTTMLILAAATSIAATLFFTLLPQLNYPETLGKITECWGDCRIVSRDGTPRKLFHGIELAAGDIVITGPVAGIHLKTNDQSFVAIGKNTQLECLAPRGKDKYTFYLHNGSILAKVSPDEDRLFSIKTPGAILDVLGTEFEAKVICDDTTQKEKNSMKQAVKKGIPALTVLTVLSGAVAVTPAEASNKVVKSGYSASVSAGKKVAVNKVRAQKFLDSVIKSNYRRQQYIWYDTTMKNSLVSSLQRYNLKTRKIENIADFLGGVNIEATFNGGALVGLGPVLIATAEKLNLNAGVPMTSGSIMIVSNSGEILNLDIIEKYNPLYSAISPDGLKLAFLGSEDSKSALYVLNFKTMRIKSILSGNMKTSPVWSPDSTKVLISSSEGYTNKHEIVSVNVNSGKVQQTGYKGCGVVFSPDGRKIVFSGNFKTGGHWFRGVPASGQLYIADYPDGKARQLTSLAQGGALKPLFSPDGSKLAYINAKQSNLHLINLQDESDIKICRLSTIATLSWSSNTKILAKPFRKKVVKEINVSKPAAKVTEIKLSEGNSSASVAQTALKSILELYLAGYRAFLRNELKLCSEKYRAACKALRSYKSEDPEFVMASLQPYLRKFKKDAAMSYRELYSKSVKEKIFMLPHILSLYVMEKKKLPLNINDLSQFASTSIIFAGFGEPNSPEAKCLLLMPDQPAGAKSNFKMKFIDAENIDFYSGITPWKEQYKIRAFKKGKSWKSNYKIELVKQQ